MRRITFFQKLAFSFLTICCGVMLFMSIILMTAIEKELSLLVFFVWLIPSMLFWGWCIADGMSWLCLE